MRTELMLVCCLLVVFAGCIGGPTERNPDVDVSIVNATEQSQNGSIAFNGEVAVLDVYGGQFVIENVRVKFKNESDTVMKTISVGTIHNTSFRRNISAVLPVPPERVVIRADVIKTDATVDVHGLKRNQDGKLEDFRQEVVVERD